MNNVDGVKISVKEEQLPNLSEKQKQEDENLLNFLDSLDDYLSVMDSLASTLRQGWLELASARHSMGASRLNSALFDLKFHEAATYLRVTENKDLISENPHFTLCKWASQTNESFSETASDDSEMLNKSGGLHLQHRDSSPSHELQDESVLSSESPTADKKVQKERSKSLAVFGTLVSPKLRAAQLSFETVLETLVEIANLRSSMLFAFNQVQSGRDHQKES